MKGRISDENDENEVQKPVVNTEKNPSVKVVKPTKPSSNAMTLKQALQNVSSKKIDAWASLTSLGCRLARCGEIQTAVPVIQW